MIDGGLRILNAGLPLIVEAVPAGDVVQLDWRPPGFGDAAVARLGLWLDDEVTADANRTAIDLVHASRPLITGIRPAADVVPGLAGARMLLHAGPPIEFERMCGPMRGALIGATLFEGWAVDPESALALLSRGSIALEPCHHHDAVGPMAGVLSPSMPVFVAEESTGTSGRRAYASLNEGLGKVLRFGAYDREVLERLAWMRDVLGPTVNAAIEASGPIDTTSLISQALAMGDEGHNRNLASTSLLARRLAPFIAAQGDASAIDATLNFLAANDHFALNISMAGAKLAMDAAVGVENSTLVTAMARNGVEFGLRVAATGEEWFTTPVEPAVGLFFPGFGPEDANPDLGDSAITETLGLGGFAMAASPAITRFVGGTADDALEATRSMRRITLAPHPGFPLPPMNFAGTPSGIDVLAVLETGELPVINTGIAHKEPGIGQIGAGIVRAPSAVFAAAAYRLAEIRGLSAGVSGMSAVLIAIGGNALVLDGEPGSIDRQLERAASFAETVADLVRDGWTVVVTHGNGPQVGFILRRGELVAPDATVEGLPNLPLWLAVADSQGGIGHMLAVALDTALDGAGLSSRAVAVLTHAEVALDDPAFQNPTKPIGGQISAAVARLRAAEEGWVVTEVEPGVFRRVVPSPAPRTIIEADSIRTLVASGAVVIAAGGGGIPVVRDDSGWHPVDAVIDKDRASALLATEIALGTLVLVTGVDQVYVDFNTPAQRPLDRVGIDEMQRHLDDGQFPAGSMGPKVASAISFVKAGGDHAIITSLPGLRDALAGRGGTHLIRDQKE